MEDTVGQENGALSPENPTKPGVNGSTEAKNDNKVDVSRLTKEDLFLITKTLAAMKEKGYSSADSRYQTLLRILLAYCQHQQTRKMLGLAETPTTDDFDQEQIDQLRAQILAYRYLSRNLALPRSLLFAIKGIKKIPPSLAPGADRLSRLSSHSKLDLSLGSATASLLTDALPPTPTATSTISTFPADPSAPSSSQSVKFNPRYLAQDREKRILSRIHQRIEELNVLVQSNLPSELKRKALIELKQLQLLPLQKQLRRKFSPEVRQLVLLQAAEDRAAFRKLSRSLGGRSRSKSSAIVDKSERSRLREELHREKKQREFTNAVVSHGRAFKEFHHGISSKWRKINRAVVAFYNTQQKKESQKKEREEKERLRALKAYNEEAYIVLLEKTKNERLRTLLNQTNEYLKKIGQLVARHQEEEEEEEEKYLKALNLEASGEEAVKEGEQKPAEKEGEKVTPGAPEVTSPKKKKPTPQDRQGYYMNAHRVEEEIDEQPKLLVGGQLKQYQLVGLQWLVSLYNNRLNGILADEMGLGKTIQTIALICYLMEKKNNNGPYLIVVPLSTLSNWEMEFAKWAPSVTALIYKGTPSVRKSLYQNHIAHGKFNVLLTTYEYIMRDKSMLGKIKWNYVIIDEGHRMKNHACKLVTVFTKYYHSRHRLLLTGTPLQNSLPELWSLLNFLLPSIFNSMDNFEEWFNAPFAAAGEKVEMTEEETLLIIYRLHKVLRPFLLRRLKKEVEDELPDKVEQVLKCGMSAWQRRMYTHMKNTGQLRVAAEEEGSGAKVKVKGLMNTLMQLRKISNHPYLFNEQQDWALDEDLVRASGKFALIDTILPKLKAAGHRLLIFSQMTSLISILEDYFHMRGYTYLRLDGSTKADERAALLTKFNAPDSPYFIFVLSTRAGGLGLNLQTADTVILFDSDWNPHIDLQASDRAHRIGQTREVRVFRLITLDTVEELILQRANWKMGLDQKVIEAGMFNKRSNAEERKSMLQDLLALDRMGTEESDTLPDDEEINVLLARDDEEFELFQKMDAERKKKEEQEWKRKGGKGRPPPRLIQDEELPAWMLTEPSGEAEKLQEYGRGLRARADVRYDDGITEKQFAKFLENGGDQSVMQRYREMNKKRRKRKRGRGGGDEDEEDEVEEVVEKKTRGRGRGRKAKTTTATPARKRKKVVVMDEEEEEEGEEMGVNGGDEDDHERKEELKAKLEKVWELVQRSEGEGGRSRSALFNKLPSAKVYPDYYQVISEPIDLKTIQQKIVQGMYADLEMAKRDFDLLWKNAMQYNMPGSEVFRDAVELQKITDAAFDAASAQQ